MSRREREYLREIVEAADSIMEIVREVDRDDILRSRRLRSALMFEAIVIGEASAHVSAEVQARYADIPWSEIVGLRHVIVHGYFGVDWNRFWAVLTNRVPDLRQRVASILTAEYPSDEPEGG